MSDTLFTNSFTTQLKGEIVHACSSAISILAAESARTATLSAIFQGNENNGGYYGRQEELKAMGNLKAQKIGLDATYVLFSETIIM